MPVSGIRSWFDKIHKYRFSRQAFVKFRGSCLWTFLFFSVLLSVSVSRRSYYQTLKKRKVYVVKNNLDLMLLHLLNYSIMFYLRAIAKYAIPYFDLLYPFFLILGTFWTFRSKGWQRRHRKTSEWLQNPSFIFRKIHFTCKKHFSHVELKHIRNT